MAHTTARRTRPKFVKWGLAACAALGLLAVIIGIATCSSSSSAPKTGESAAPAPRKETLAAIEAARLDAELGKIAKSQEPPLYLELGKPATVELKTDEWSREFVIPQDPEKPVVCKVSEQPQEGFWFYFKLRDTNPFFNVPAASETHEVPYAGIAVQHRLFRLLGKKLGQKAILVATAEP